MPAATLGAEQRPLAHVLFVMGEVLEFWGHLWRPLKRGLRRLFVLCMFVAGSFSLGGAVALTVSPSIRGEAELQARAYAASLLEVLKTKPESSGSRFEQVNLDMPELALQKLIDRNVERRRTEDYWAAPAVGRRIYQMPYYEEEPQSTEEGN